MKDKKICFSRTVAYLLGLAIILIGAFYVINYSNTQKLGINPKAAFQSKKCLYGGQEITEISVPYEYESKIFSDGSVGACIYNRKSRSFTGYRCKTDSPGNITGGSEKDEINCPRPCLINGKPLSSWKTTAGNDRYNINDAGCVSDYETIANGGKNGGNTGYLCDIYSKTTTKTKLDIATCPIQTPTSAVSTTIGTKCLINGKPLSSWKSKNGNTRYFVNDEGCVADFETTANGGKDGYNNGYLCDFTIMKTKWDIKTCPVQQPVNRNIKN